MLFPFVADDNGEPVYLIQPLDFHQTLTIVRMSDDVWDVDVAVTIVRWWAIKSHGDYLYCIRFDRLDTYKRVGAMSGHYFEFKTEEKRQAFFRHRTQVPVILSELPEPALRR